MDYNGNGISDLITLCQALTCALNLYYLVHLLLQLCDTGALLQIIRSGSHNKWLSWHLNSSLFCPKVHTFFFLLEKGSPEREIVDLKEVMRLGVSVDSVTHAKWIFDTQESGISSFWQPMMAEGASWTWANGPDSHCEWGFCHYQGHSSNVLVLCPQEILSFSSSSSLLPSLCLCLTSPSSGRPHGKKHSLSSCVFIRVCVYSYTWKSVLLEVKSSVMFSFLAYLKCLCFLALSIAFKVWW